MSEEYLPHIYEEFSENVVPQKQSAGNRVGTSYYQIYDRADGVEVFRWKADRVLEQNLR